MMSTMPYEKGTSKKEKIIEVFEDNFVAEIKRLGDYLSNYNYIGMDTEFPGIVFQLENYSKDFYYKSIKANVDRLKLIQVGVTLCNEKGEYPSDTSTWQFNLRFDYHEDQYSIESVSLLSNAGIEFEKLKKGGIPFDTFAEYLMVSGLVLNENVHWISFHGSYDFAYLYKLLINSALPDNEEEFTEGLELYFPNHYDIRILVRSQDNLKGGLNRLAQYLEVFRVGMTHQAGSDSMVTAEVFFKLLKNQHITCESIEQERNVLFGIGDGADDNETLSYTPFSNCFIFNNNNTNNPRTQVNNPLQMQIFPNLDQITPCKNNKAIQNMQLLIPYISNMNNVNMNNGPNFNMYSSTIAKTPQMPSNMGNVNSNINNKMSNFVNVSNIGQQNNKKCTGNNIVSAYSN